MKQKRATIEQSTITAATSLIHNFKPINPPISYMKKALEFIRKTFNEQKIDIKEEIRDTVLSNEQADLDDNYNLMQSLLEDNPDVFKDGCNLKYNLKVVRITCTFWNNIYQSAYLSVNILDN